MRRLLVLLAGATLLVSVAACTGTTNAIPRPAAATASIGDAAADTGDLATTAPVTVTTTTTPVATTTSTSKSTATTVATATSSVHVVVKTVTAAPKTVKQTVKETVKTTVNRIEPDVSVTTDIPATTTETPTTTSVAPSWCYQDASDNVLGGPVRVLKNNGDVVIILAWPAASDYPAFKTPSGLYLRTNGASGVVPNDYLGRSHVQYGWAQALLVADGASAESGAVYDGAAPWKEIADNDPVGFAHYAAGSNAAGKLSSAVATWGHFADYLAKAGSVPAC